MMQRPVAPVVTVRETDLFAVVCHAMESGEFRQIRGAFVDGDNGRCAWGVVAEIMQRAGVPLTRRGFAQVHPRIDEITERAGQMLGYSDMAEANDRGESFRVIAPALRAARIEVESRAS